MRRDGGWEGRHPYVLELVILELVVLELVVVVALEPVVLELEG